jgi:hypothetical protein
MTVAGTSTMVGTGYGLLLVLLRAAVVVMVLCGMVC